MSNMLPDVANGKATTLSAIMSAYDGLPRKLRTVLRDAPFSYDPRSVQAMWNRKKQEGWSVERMAEFTADTINEDVVKLKHESGAVGPSEARVARPKPPPPRG